MLVFVLPPWQQNLGAVGNELGGMNMGSFSAALLKKQTQKNQQYTEALSTYR